MRITDTKGVAPTNYKSGMLFLNKYRLIDMIIMGGALIWGFVWVILLFFVFVPNMFSFVFFVILCPIIAIGLVQPLPNYHNNLEYLRLQFLYKRRTKYYTNIAYRNVKAKRGKRKG